MSKLNGVLMVLVASVISACGGGDEEATSSNTYSSNSNSSAQTSSSAQNSSSGNSQASGSLRISEIVAKSEIDAYLEGNDWFELRNIGSTAINLSAYTVTDSASEHWALPDQTIQPGEYIVIAAVDEEEPLTDGTPYVPFKLGSEDALNLYLNGQLVDNLSWLDGEAKQGRSYGQLNNQAQTLYPTPGYDNVPYILFTKDQVFKVEVEIEPSEWQALLSNAQAEEWHPANFIFNGAKISNMGIRTKGQSSLSMMGAIPDDHPTKHRYGFKIDFNRYQEQKFMGMKMLVLGNGFADPSMMRDVVSYQLFKDAGVPAPETSFVDLWVGGEHLGLYQLIEAIDGEFVEKYFPDDKDADLKGDLYKAEVLNTLTWEGSNIDSYAGLELKTNEETIDTPDEGAALLRFLDTLNNGPDRLAHVHVDLMLRYFAALALTGNTDSYLGFSANNFYLYENRSTDSFAILPWDFNLGLGVVGSTLQDPGATITDEFLIGSDPSFGGGGFFGGGGGNFSFGGGGFGGGGFGGGAIVSCDTVEHKIDTPASTTGDRPLITALLESPELLQQYRDHIRFLVEGPFSPESIRADILRWADLIDPYIQADPTKFFTYTEWRHNLNNDMPSNSNNQGGRGGNFFGPATGLLRFIDDRIANVQQQLNGQIPSVGANNAACAQ